MLIERMFAHLIEQGTLDVIDAHGRSPNFGDGGAPRAAIRLHDASLHWRPFFNPSLCAGEAYTDGTLTIEEGSLYEFLYLIALNVERSRWHSCYKVRAGFDSLAKRIMQFNPINLARARVAHHYDLAAELYETFLDDDLQYSCAYFRSENDTLEQAQENKKRHIAKKLLLQPGQKVLDIGSGWGGMGLFLAREYGVTVTGLTLSSEQLAYANQRARNEGLEGRVQFHPTDYREQTGSFDRIVSVGMFEHVGVNHYPAFFSKIQDLLTDDGVALVHTIGRTDGPGVTDPWIRKYIFPGGYSPTLSEILPAIENLRLLATDVEVLRLHYALTLRHWRARFAARRDRIVALYDARFARMWEYYLALSEISFRCLDNVNFQIQLAKRQDAVPLTRDYLGEGADRDNRQQFASRHSAA